MYFKSQLLDSGYQKLSLNKNRLQKYFLQILIRMATAKKLNNEISKIWPWKYYVTSRKNISGIAYGFDKAIKG